MRPLVNDTPALRRPLRSWRAFCAWLAMLLFSAPVFAADPITLILLRIVRDRIISAGIERVYESAIAKPPAQAVVPRTLPPVSPGLDDQQLRRLIDEGFVHLNSGQREEVYVSLRRILDDPNNAAQVPAIIAQLTTTAAAVRQAHDSISKLTPERKRRIAMEAREEYENMSPENRDELTKVLRARVVPLPADLTDMILSEFDAVRANTGALAPAKSP